MEGTNILKAFKRHLVADNSCAYSALLSEVHKNDDVWIASQQKFFFWWKSRLSASLNVKVKSTQIIVESDLSNAAIEMHTADGTKKIIGTINLNDRNASDGPVKFIIKSKGIMGEICSEAMDIMGIRNYYFGENNRHNQGTVIEIDGNFNDRLEDIKNALEKDGIGLEDSLNRFRDQIVKKCADKQLPLFCIHYQPIIDGHHKKVCFSPRFDVERAIWAIPKISQISSKYGVQPTFYLRAFSRMYGCEDILKYCSNVEVGLHGEFLSNCKTFGGLSEAAIAEEKLLRETLNRNVTLFNMHGGDGKGNEFSDQAYAAASAGLKCDGTYWQDVVIPFRPLFKGEFSPIWRLNYRDAPKAMDIIIAENSSKTTYSENFLKCILNDLDEVIKRNGVAIPMMHTEYFGLLEYFTNPKRIYKFFMVTGSFIGRRVLGFLN